jgi:hypothetical protein
MTAERSTHFAYDHTETARSSTEVPVSLLVRRERRAFSAGATPARQLSFQPVAIGAAMEVTISSKPLMEKGRLAAQQVGRP